MTELAVQRPAAGDAHPEALVSTTWVAAHVNDPAVRIVEAVEDPLLYEVGHVPGAVKLDWHTELQTPIGRDVVDKAGFEHLLGRLGIANEADVVVYCWVGERSSHTWFALTQLPGYSAVRHYDGGWSEWGNLVDVPVARTAP